MRDTSKAFTLVLHLVTDVSADTSSFRRISTDMIWNRRVQLGSIEALANFWAQENFQHPDCCNSCIMKTSSAAQGDGSTLINVTAMASVQNVCLILVSMARTVRRHDVPVEW